MGVAFFASMGNAYGDGGCLTLVEDRCVRFSPVLHGVHLDVTFGTDDGRVHVWRPPLNETAGNAR